MSRLRRTLLYALAFTSVQTVIVCGASLAQFPAIRRSSDARLVRTAVAVSRALPHADGVSASDLRAAVERHEDLHYAELIEADGSRVAVSAPDAGVPEHPPVTLDRVHVGDVDVARLGVVREATVPFRDPLGRRRAVRAVARWSANDHALERLADRLWIVLPASFLAAAIVSWLLLRSALNPLREVARTMRGLGPETFGSLPVAVDLTEADEEVVRLQRSLHDALERLEEGYRAQSEFVANVAHELKTPIAVMLAEAQSLRGDDVDVDELRDFQRSVTEEMRRLGKLVESFLVVARAARGGALTRHETVFLPEVVVDAVQHTKRLAEGHGVVVRPILPSPEACAVLEMSGDPELLGSMVENLIRNAIKYSPRGAYVDVRMIAEPGRARIAVRDRGPGVPPGIAERLFGRYVQAPTEGGRARGFGLGLSIAANVARLHGGSIAVENCADGGARFTVTLDLEGAPPGPEDAFADV